MSLLNFKQSLGRWCQLAVRGCSFAQRDPRGAVLALRMAVWIMFISGMVKVFALPRVFTVITPRNRARLEEVELDSANFRMAQLADRLLNLNFLVFTPICWKRAAVLYRYLALYGIRSSVIFGVRKDDGGQLIGHAWLEVEGSPVLEKNPPDYHVTYTFPAR